MPIDTVNLFKRILIPTIYPPFFEQAKQLVANCSALNSDYYATSGFRSYVEQALLFEQGRTRIGKIVTNAKPGQSFHNFGIAMDFTHDLDMVKPGLQPDWVDANYILLAKEAVKVGLEPGALWTGFKDIPHVQLKISKHNIQLPTLANLYTTNKGGLPAVWAYLDKFVW